MDSSRVTFTNSPTLSEHEIQTPQNERKLALIPHVENFLKKHPIFGATHTRVSFFGEGSSSFTCLVEISNSRQVLKIPLHSHPLYESEALFLRTWEKAGVKVPRVLEEVTIDGTRGMLLEYIDAPTLNKLYRKGEMVKKELFVKMGAVLRKMHAAKAEGFGVVKDGKGGYALFSEWIDYEIYRKKPHLDGAAFLDDDKHGNFKKAVETLTAFVGTSSESTYCHNDFAYQNIFATEPLTVFDPLPIFGHPYLDLARAIITAIGRGIHEEAGEQLMRGYSGDDLVLDRKVLQAAILIQSYTKFGYWSKTGKEEGIRQVQAYLEKNKGFLE